jgi:hypothetical protein
MNRRKFLTFVSIAGATVALPVGALVPATPASLPCSDLWAMLRKGMVGLYIPGERSRKAWNADSDCVCEWPACGGLPDGWYWIET